MTKESVILTSGKANGTMLNYILYSNGSEIRYVNKQENQDYPFVTLEDATDRVTYMTYTVYLDYEYLIVGTEQGKLLFYNVQEMKANPELLEEFDLGETIISAKELSSYSSGDRY